MRPDTWLPTCTVTSADTVPVAVTRDSTSRRCTAVVSKLAAESFVLGRASHTPASTTAARSSNPSGHRLGRCQRRVGASGTGVGLVGTDGSSRRGDSVVDLMGQDLCAGMFR